MADDAGQVGADEAAAAAAAAASATPPPPDALTQLQSDLAAERAEHQATRETLRALSQRGADSGYGAGGASPPSGSPVPGLDSRFVNLLRQRGLSDADIAANAPIIQPFLESAIQLYGAELLGVVGQQRDEFDEFKASQSKDEFPFWGDLKPEIAQIRKEARQANQYLSPKQAYQAAVAQNFDKLVEKRAAQIAAGGAPTGAAGRAASMTAEGDLSNVGRPARGQGPRTAADAAALPPDDREKLYNEYAERAF